MKNSRKKRDERADMAFEKARQDLKAIDESRRRFMQQTIASLGALGAMSAAGCARKTFEETPETRRHLVVIQPGGASGYDAASFHMGMNPDLMRGVESYTRFNADPVNPVGQHWTPRDYGLTSQLSGFAHPNHPDGTVYMGPGMDMFRDSVGRELLSEDILLAVGKWRDGGHDVGSIVAACGQRSRYAIGFASLIAQDLGRRFPKTLNYVQLAGPGTLYSHVGFLGGPAEPVNIPSEESLAAMIQPNPSDVGVSRRGAVDQLIRDIGNSVSLSSFKRRSSVEVFASFMQSLTGSTTLKSGNWLAKGGKLDTMRIAYQDEILKTLTAHPYYARWQANKPLAKEQTAVMGRINVYAFHLALTEFLIATNQSSVIELPGMFGDYHGNNAQEAVYMVALFAGIKKFLHALKYDHGSDSGAKANLLESTTLVMFSEFDRAMELSGSAATPGTDHGSRATVLMAGAGVQGGKVIGRVKMGPGEGLDASGDYKSVELGGALPVDLATGNPMPVKGGSDTYMRLENVFPTIMTMFGVSIPGQQIAADKAVPAILKKS